MGTTCNELTTARQELQPAFNNGLINEFLAGNKMKPKTFETYKKNLKAFFIWMQANGITEPTKRDIIKYTDYLAATYKPTTANGYYNAVRQLFKWLQAEGLINVNITANVKTGVKITHDFKKAYLTQDQAQQLLNSIDRSTPKGKRDYAIILLCLCCGLRTVEIERANIGDIKPNGCGLVLYVQGKGHSAKDQFVKLPAVIDAAIRDYLRTRESQDLDSPLFTSEASNHKNSRIVKESVSRLIKNQLRAIGLNNELYTAHALRHTAATLNLLNGGTLEETQQLLRHENITTTMIYNHALKREANQSENRLAGLLVKD